MKIVAIAANVAQLVIILAIFFIRGLELGALVIFLLFLMMSVPFINFLTLFFSNGSMLKSTSSAVSESENGLIKREAIRIDYHDDRCPVLKTGNTAFTVRDLSEGGVCISASLSTPFKKKVKGEIQLVSGDRIRFKATLMRREEGQVVFQFANPIGTALLLEEKKAMAVDDNPNRQD